VTTVEPPTTTPAPEPTVAPPPKAVEPIAMSTTPVAPAPKAAEPPVRPKAKPEASAPSRTPAHPALAPRPKGESPLPDPLPRGGEGVSPDELPSRGRAATAPTAAALEARLKKNEAAISAGATKGGKMAAQMVLDDIKLSQKKASSAADRIAVDTELDRWERNYLPKALP
jgi:fused signal recognition particle receptor